MPGWGTSHSITRIKITGEHILMKRIFSWCFAFLKKSVSGCKEEELMRNLHNFGTMTEATKISQWWQVLEEEWWGGWLEMLVAWHSWEKLHPGLIVRERGSFLLPASTWSSASILLSWWRGAWCGRWPYSFIILKMPIYPCSA